MLTFVVIRIFSRQESYEPSAEAIVDESSSTWGFHWMPDGDGNGSVTFTIRNSLYMSNLTWGVAREAVTDGVSIQRIWLIVISVIVFCGVIRLLHSWKILITKQVKKH